MIQIELQPEDISFGEDEGALLLGLSASAVESVYFILPFCLRVNGIELLENDADDRPVFICQVERKVF